MNNNSSGKGGAIFHVLHALFWAVAMIGASYMQLEGPLGSDIVIWMIGAYFVINGLFVSRCFGRSRSSE